MVTRFDIALRPSQRCPSVCWDPISRRSLLGTLALALEGQLTMAAEEEGENPKQAEQKVITCSQKAHIVIQLDSGGMGLRL